MSKRRKSNHKRNQRKSRVAGSQSYLSLSASAFVAEMSSVDPEFSRFVGASIAEHQARFGSPEPGGDERLESRHALPKGFGGGLAEIVIVTDVSARKVSTAVMFDAEYEGLRSRDGEVPSLTELGKPSEAGLTLSVSEL